MAHAEAGFARGYQLTGMTAHSWLQEKEFSRESQYGYEAVKHQRFVGTGYFDRVRHVISAGLASTVALAESTEAARFTEMIEPSWSHRRPDAGCQPILGECPNRNVTVDFGSDDMLLPSGD